MGRLARLLLLAAALLLASCGPSTERAFHGYLYFVQSPYLLRFALRDGSLEVVTHLGNSTVREISPFGPDRLLIAETATVNRRGVARIAWMDLKTGQVESLYEGVQARFVESAGAIVYDDGGTVYAVYLAGGEGADVEVLSHRRNQLSAMLEVADGELLIETAEDGRPVIHAYRAADRTLRRLDALAARCRLDGAVWIGESQRLLCRERADGDGAGYVFSDLDGAVLGRPALPADGAWRALAWIADQGVVVFSQSGKGFGGQDAFSAWAHDLRSGENHPLSDSHDLGSSVVYTRY